MPVQKGKSLMERLGSKGKAAFNEHKADETKLSQTGDLPEGIEMGVATLVELKFDIYKDGANKGKDYFYAAGVVTAPADVKGYPIKGLRTSIMEPLCDTPGRKRATIADHLAWVLNEIRKLGLETKDLGDDEFEDAVKGLKESGVSFRFRTWKGEATKDYPDPRVNHEWKGACDSPVDADTNGEVVDETAAEEEEVAEKVVEEGPDLDALAKKADKNDKKAQAELTKLAKDTGVDPEALETWADVAEAINSGAAEVEEGGSEAKIEEEVEESAEEEVVEEETKEPTKGEIAMYKPKGKKGPEECEVILVDKKAKTLKVKSLDDGKVYAGVPFDKVSIE